MLTFRVNQDVTVSTDHSAQAFRYVQPSDYEQAAQTLVRRPMPPRPAYGFASGYYPYGYPYYGGYPYWGGIYFGGPRFYGRRW